MNKSDFLRQAAKFYDFAEDWGGVKDFLIEFWNIYRNVMAANTSIVEKQDTINEPIFSQHTAFVFAEFLEFFLLNKDE